MYVQKKVAGVDVPVVHGRSVSDKRGKYTNGAHRKRKQSVRERAGLPTTSRSVYSSGVDYKARRVQDELALEAKEFISDVAVALLEEAGVELPDFSKQPKGILEIRNGWTVIDRDVDREKPLPEKESEIVHKLFKKLPRNKHSCGSKGARGRSPSVNHNDDVQPVSRGVPRLSLPEKKQYVGIESALEKEDKKFRAAIEQYRRQQAAYDKLYGSDS